MKKTLNVSIDGDKTEEVVVSIVHSEDTTGIVRAKAREIVTSGFAVKNGSRSTYYPPSRIFSVKWDDEIEL